MPRILKKRLSLWQITKRTHETKPHFHCTVHRCADVDSLPPQQPRRCGPPGPCRLQLSESQVRVYLHRARARIKAQYAAIQGFGL